MGSMEGFGPGTETTGPKATTSVALGVKGQQMHTATVEVSVAPSMLALQNFAKKIPLPKDLGIKIPLPKGDLSGIKAIATPLMIKRALDSFRGYISLSPESRPIIDLTKLDRARELLKGLVKEQRESVLEILRRTYLKNFGDVAAKAANDAAKERKIPEMKASLGLALGAGNEQARIGMGTIMENHQRILDIASKGLNEQQKMDMLRAAAELGYCSAEVFKRARPPEIDAGGQMPVERDRTLQQLLQASVLTATRLSEELKQAGKNLKSDPDNEKYQQQYQAAFSQFAAFLGSERKAEDFMKMGAEGNEAIAIALSISMDMHAYGKLGVVPVKRAPKQAMA